MLTALGDRADLDVGSLDYPFSGHQTIQMYGNFEGYSTLITVHCLDWKYNGPCSPNGGLAKT